MVSETQIQFRKTDWIHKNLILRIDSTLAKKQSDVARRDLTRYYYMLLYTASEIELTKEEFMVICEALNGHIATDDALLSARTLHVQVEDFINYYHIFSLEYDWKILIERIKNMTAAQKQCIIDVVERFWGLENKDVEYTSFLEFFKLLSKQDEQF